MVQIAIVVAVMLACFIAATVCLWVRAFHESPKPDVLIANYWGRPLEEVLGVLVVTSASAWTDNQRLLQSKASALKWAIGLLVAVVLVTIVQVVLSGR